MKYYENLLDMKCFTYLNILNLVGGNENTAHSLIRSYVKKGYIQQVRRNLYVAISLESAGPVASRYMIASSINNDSYVSHHSAFEYYGYANQVYYEMTVSSGSKFSEFEFDGYSYCYIPSRIEAGVIFKNGVRLTDIERTILDYIYDFDRIGGLEELLRCLELIPYAEEEKLLCYLMLYNKQILYQKAGYILENYKDSLKLSKNFFDECKNHIQKSVRYFSNEMPKEQMKYNREWNLMIPEWLMQIIK